MKTRLLWPPVRETLACTNGAALLFTDLVKAEPLLAQLAPGKGDVCKKTYIFVRAAYTPPYEKNFPVIARAEAAIWNAKGFSPGYSGLAAFDVTEWLGHTDEERFQILLEYWSDQRGIMGHPCFLVRDARPEQQRELLHSCLRFLPTDAFDVRVFENNERLTALLRQKFEQSGHPVSTEGLALLAKLLAAPEWKAVRLLSLLDRAVQELIWELPSGRALGRRDIIRWAGRDDCLLARLGGCLQNVLEAEKEGVYENKNV